MGKLLHRHLLLACLLILGSFGKAHSRTIDFWHPWPQTQRSVQRLAAEYSRATGTTVRVRVYQASSRSPWTSRTVPDVIGLYGPSKKTIDNLVAQGRAYNLAREMGQGWYARFWPGMLETFQIRSRTSGIYGVPLTGTVHMFVYNKNVFRKAGINRLPRDWFDLLSFSLSIRKRGVIPYAGGFGSNTPPLAHAYEWSYLGLHNLIQTYFGRYPYTNRAWINYLGMYPEMRRFGFTNSVWATRSESSAIKAMLDGKVAMVFVGPEFESIRRAYKPGFTSWGLFKAPPDLRARYLPRQPGGVVQGVVINSRSDTKAEAVRFVRWLTEPRQQIILANSASAIPASSYASSSTALQSHLRAFASGMRDQSIDLRAYERPQVLRTFYSGIRSLLAGSGSPSAVASNTQRVKRR